MPYPPDYGGVYDLFYKIRALHENGVAIHLHCFEYGRGEQPELTKFCKSINYYKRRGIFDSLQFRLPYIVSSRADRELLDNLNGSDIPILLEGIHCTYFLYNNDIRNRIVFVRLHNVEYKYYAELAKSTRNILKKLYFIAESKLLKAYEKSIANKAVFLAVSEKDKMTYEEKLHAGNAKFLPVFLPFSKVSSETGNGHFCLYQGNLSVGENEKAVLWILKKVFDTVTIPFVIAGRNPSKYLENEVHLNRNVCLVGNPSASEMKELIQKAHVHILPSFNNTGIKIKLLNALFMGRFVVANDSALEGTHLAHLCKIANTASDYKRILAELFEQSFTDYEISERKKILDSVYNNEANARQLMQWIY